MENFKFVSIKPFPLHIYCRCFSFLHLFSFFHDSYCSASVLSSVPRGFFFIFEDSVRICWQLGHEALFFHVVFLVFITSLLTYFPHDETIVDSTSWNFLIFPFSSFLWTWMMRWSRNHHYSRFFCMWFAYASFIYFDFLLHFRVNIGPFWMFIHLLLIYKYTFSWWCVSITHPLFFRPRLLILFFSVEKKHILWYALSSSCSLQMNQMLLNFWCDHSFCYF